MEFTKEISFDEKLTADKVATINYHGKLLDTNSDNVSIVYGFGQNWEYTEEKKMNRVDGGFEVEVPIKDYDTFNFCFKDGYNNWDNNSQFNYISPINKEDGNHSSGSGSGSDKKSEDEVEEIGVESTISGDVEDDSGDDVKVELAEIEAEISRIFDELFDVEEEDTTIEGAFNQLFAEAGYDMDYNAYRAEINREVEKQSPIPEPQDKDEDENEEGSSDIEDVFDMLFKEAGYTETYKSYKHSMEIEQAVADAFNQLFAEAGYAETYDSYREYTKVAAEVGTLFSQVFDEESSSEPVVEPEDEQEVEENDVYDIGAIFNELFKQAGYSETYESYRESVNTMQAVADTFNQLFAEAGYDETYDSYRAEISRLVENQSSVPESQEDDSKETSLDELVDEILKPVSESYNVPDEVANVNQVSNVDDFDGIDIKNIELDDIDNIEVDDATRDELQQLIEEIDAQIALFEEKDEEEQESSLSVEDGIANIEETIQVPSLRDVEFANTDEEDKVVKTSTESVDSDVSIDELFDYLKKYDDEDEENEVVDEGEDTSVEDKVSLFDETEEQNQPIEEEKVEPEVSENVKLVEGESEEQSIFDKVKEQKNQDLLEESTELTVSSRKLRNFYRITKRIKLAFIKVFYGIPKLLGRSHSTDNDE